jgi:hypothetical protein
MLVKIFSDFVVPKSSSPSLLQITRPPPGHFLKKDILNQHVRTIVPEIHINIISRCTLNPPSQNQLASSRFFDKFFFEFVPACCIPPSISHFSFNNQTLLHQACKLRSCLPICIQFFASASHVARTVLPSVFCHYTDRTAAAPLLNNGLDYEHLHLKTRNGILNGQRRRPSLI